MKRLPIFHDINPECWVRTHFGVPGNYLGDVLIYHYGCNISLSFFFFWVTWNNPSPLSIILDDKKALLLNFLNISAKYRFWKYLSRLSILSTFSFIFPAHLLASIILDDKRALLLNFLNISKEYRFWKYLFRLGFLSTFSFIFPTHL